MRSARGLRTPVRTGSRVEFLPQGYRNVANLLQAGTPGHRQQYGDCAGIPSDHVEIVGIVPRLDHAVEDRSGRGSQFIMPGQGRNPPGGVSDAQLPEEERKGGCRLFASRPLDLADGTGERTQCRPTRPDISGHRMQLSQEKSDPGGAAVEFGPECRRSRRDRSVGRVDFRR